MRFLLVFAILSCPLVSAAQSHGRGKEADIAVSKRLQLIAKAPDQAISGDIDLSLTLKNTSSATVAFADTNPDQDFELVVRTSDDHEVPLTDLGNRLATEREHGGSRMRRELKPGESLDYVVSLGTRYRFDKARQYTVRASRVVELEARSAPLERVVSNTLTITLQ